MSKYFKNETRERERERVKSKAFGLWFISLFTWLSQSQVRKKIKHKTNFGFTLIELLVVIAIIGLLSSVVLASLNSARKKARDARRLVDMKQMQLALELYYDQFNRYPDSDFAGCGGWDSSGNGTFITPLVNNSFLPSHILDPTVNDSCGNYAYYRYPANYENCTIPFYVIGVRDMETSGNPYPGSPGWSCPTRNWQAEFDWVIGKFE